MTKKPAIPAIAANASNAYDALVAVKQNLDILTGRRGGGLTPLASTAALSDVITAVNAIIARLNAGS